MSMPAQRPGKSRQDYSTPPEFLEALREHLGIRDFNLDAAASRENAITTPFYDGSPGLDGLVEPWDSWTFCNPPFGNIRPWVAKAWEEGEENCSAVLVPAAVGSNWWKDWVHNSAHVLFLNGRLSFDGKAPYPKDCAILLYTPYCRGGYEVWSWRG